MADQDMTGNDWSGFEACKKRLSAAPALKGSPQVPAAMGEVFHAMHDEPHIGAMAFHLVVPEDAIPGTAQFVAACAEMAAALQAHAAVLLPGARVATRFTSTFWLQQLLQRDMDAFIGQAIAASDAHRRPGPDRLARSLAQPSEAADSGE